MYLEQEIVLNPYLDNTYIHVPTGLTNTDREALLEEVRNAYAPWNIIPERKDLKYVRGL